VFYILGLFTDEAREYLDALREKVGSAPVGFSGYYHTEWDKGGNRPQRELLRLRERRGHIVGKLLYAVDLSTNYKAKGRLFMDGEVLLTWRNPDKHISGTIHTAKKGSGIHEGRWTGASPTARQNINADSWKMSRLRLSELPIPDLRLDLSAHRAALAELIKAHEKQLASSHGAWSVDVAVTPSETVNLLIQSGIFDPSLGSGSKRLLEYASTLTPKDVLDLGFGSGLFSIYFAKHKGSHVVGTDLNESAIYCASANAARNGVSVSCEFLHGDLYRPIYSAFRLDRQFDLIIANLPFSRSELVRQAVRAAHVPKARVRSYNEMFASSTELLKNVFYGAPFFLKPGGRLLLLTGGSADLRVLREASAFSTLSSARQAGDMFSGKSEQLMVVALQKS
jgi:methylase of polypeptide subunit release factors